MSAQRIRTFIIAILVLGLVVEVVLLGFQNRRLKRSLEETMESPQAAAELSVGDMLPALELVDLAGRADRLTFLDSEGSRILFVFNTRCPVCEETRPAWKRLAAALDGSLEVVGLAAGSVEEVANYSIEHGLNFPVYLFANQEMIRRLNVRQVPQTILLAGDGTVIARWSGRIPAEQVAWIEHMTSRGGTAKAALSVKIPLGHPGRRDPAASSSAGAPEAG